MPLNIINVVSNISKINMGVWKAALAGSDYLSQKDIKTFLLICDKSENEGESEIPPDVEIWYLQRNKWKDSLRSALLKNSLLSSNTIVVTHGSWLMPTRVGAFLRTIKYKWVYVPQGMLEPWSLKQSALRKQIYFRLIEGRLIKAADAIRSVSTIEQTNLRNLLGRQVVLITNGVQIPPHQNKKNEQLQYLFMARLHAKKGILPLVEAWSKVMRNSKSRLCIAGPDEGELEKIKPYLVNNTEYVGPVYGEEKKQLLINSHYYLLPSYSEGLPSSVLEAMSYGLIPLISAGCNFPDVFSNNLGYEIEPNRENIARSFETLLTKRYDYDLSARNRAFIETHYSTSVIGEKLFSLYINL